MHYHTINPFPHDKILNQTKLKAVADNKLNVTEMIISVFNIVEKHCGKRRNCLYKQFLLFPQCFQRVSFLDASKGVIVWEWVLMLCDTLEANAFGKRWGSGENAGK